MSETFLILRRIWRYIIKNVYWSSSKVTLFLSDYNETWIFSTIFEKRSNRISRKSAEQFKSFNMLTVTAEWSVSAPASRDVGCINEPHSTAYRTGMSAVWNWNLLNWEHPYFQLVLCGYKNQSVNAVYGNNRCLFWDPHKTQIHWVGRTWNFWMSNWWNI